MLNKRPKGPFFVGKIKMERSFILNTDPLPRWQLIAGCAPNVTEIGLIHAKQSLLEYLFDIRKIGILELMEQSDALTKKRDVEIFVIANKIVRNRIDRFRCLAEEIIEVMISDGEIRSTLSDRFLQVTGITTRLNSAN